MAGLAALGLSWVLYPTASVPQRPSPVMASIGSDRAVKSVELTIEEPLDQPNEYLVIVTGSSSDTSQGGGSVDVFVVIPDVLLAPGLTNQLQCSPSCNFVNEFEQGATLMRTRFELKPAWKPNKDGSSTFSVQVGVPFNALVNRTDAAATVLQMPGMDCSDVACRGSVPLVTVSQKTPIAVGAMTLVNFHDFTLDDYQWDSALSPYTDGNIGFTFNYPLKPEPQFGYISQYPADGTNIQQEGRMQFETFAAGALVGIAGALLLGAAQDAVTVSGENRSHSGAGSG
jgi:hypothetical protein